MISFACSACSKALKAKDELAGKSGKCPGCGKPIVVPATTPNRTEVGKPSPVPASGPAPIEERPLPPKGSATDDSEARMLPPANSAGNARPNDSSGSDTIGTGAKGGHPAELSDFLAPAQAADEIGRLGHYRVLKILGHGGMGVVYEAEEVSLDRRVALKAMLPGLAVSESARKRFVREAKTAAAVEHDHIVPIFYVGEDRGVPFIAMPFLQGEPLDERLKREPPLTMAEIVRIGREVAEGLAAAHERGLVHRDIKPGNIWLEGKRGRVRILDFGLARQSGGGTELTQQGAVVGTPAYMAPEQANGAEVDGRCDLFSLGCVLYRLCTGRPAFSGRDTLSTLMAVASTNPPAPCAINKAVPAALSDLVVRLLAKDPNSRPASAEVVATEMAALAADSTNSATSPGMSTASPPRTTKARTATAARPGRGVAIGAGIVLVLLLLAVGLLFSLRTRTGTLVVNLIEPDVEVLVDGEATASSSGVARLELLPGEHRLVVKCGAEELYSAPFTVQRGTEVVLDAKWTPKKYTNSLGMEFVLVPKGKSWLGGGAGQAGTKEVEIEEDFYLGKYEVTQEEWERVTGLNPSSFKAVTGVAREDQKRFPVEQVSWDDCQQFIERLNKQVKDGGWVYRLPTEVEWEYACRGGPMSDKFDSAFDFYFDKPVGQLQPEQANFAHGKGLKRTCKVGSYKPNKLGLYDMHGNVWEWCDDLFAPNDKDPQMASLRGYRGGSWNCDSGACRAASRLANAPSDRSRDFGLRLARVPVGKEIVAPK